ncbi:MAG: glycosyltransferase family 2 protein [Bacteroidetes bacterium]|nr:glycosyltransferase family 2 protein [Bacteroidota bacterium]
MEPVELAVVMPVYNEEAIIGTVVRKWLAHLDQCRLSYQLHVYNDGSTDKTQQVLSAITHPRLIIHHKSNSGHGPTILLGYKENQDKQWIFQIDSDDELDVAEFLSFWEKRKDYDFLIGQRTNRQGHFSRKIISLISRLSVRILFGKGVSDVNCPYRLMRVTPEFGTIINRIPENTNTPNIIITGFYCMRDKRIIQIPVKYSPRNTGKSSLVKMKLVSFSVKSFLQLVKLRFRAVS